MNLNITEIESGKLNRFLQQTKILDRNIYFVYRTLVRRKIFNNIKIITYISFSNAILIILLTNYGKVFMYWFFSIT